MASGKLLVPGNQITEAVCTMLLVEMNVIFL